MFGHIEKRKVTHEIGETVQKDEAKNIKIGLATSRFPAGLQWETAFLTHLWILSLLALQPTV